MSNNKLIQILRGTETYDTTVSTEILNDGQPFYSKRDKALYIGDGTSELKTLEPIGASNLRNGSRDSTTGQFQSNLEIKNSATTFDRNSGTYLTQGGDNVRPHPSNGKYIESYPVGSDNVNSIALGTETYAHGPNSTTLGKKNYAGSNQTLAAGQGTRALDIYSATFGENTIAGARSTFVVGADSVALGAQTFIGGGNNMSGGYASIIHGRDNTEGYYLYDTHTNKLYLTTKKLADTMTLEAIKDVELTTSGVLNSTTGLTYTGKVYTLGRDEENNPRILINGTEAGIYIMSNNQRYIAFGDNSNSDSNILPKYNIISGRSNKISMQSIQNILSGTGNTISKCNSSIISGADNTVLGGNYLAVLGGNNIARGNASILMGDNNEIPLDGANNPHLRCALFGTYLQAGASNQTIVGKFNTPNAGALFQVGIGTDQYRLKSNSSTLISAATYAALSDDQKANYERNRKNAFTVSKDGIVTVTKTPGSPYEVLRYSDLIPNSNGDTSTNGFNIKVQSTHIGDKNIYTNITGNTFKACNETANPDDYYFTSDSQVTAFKFDKPLYYTNDIGQFVNIEEEFRNVASSVTSDLMNEIDGLDSTKANKVSNFSSNYTVLYGYVSGDTLYVLGD